MHCVRTKARGILGLWVLLWSLPSPLMYLILNCPPIQVEG